MMDEITRIVRLCFNPSDVNTFLGIFDKSAPLIRAFPGCLEVRLMRDHDVSHVYFTLSRWENHGSLENYRNSVLFKETWAQTKVLFKEKALAYSLKSV
jgi:quinol monooxygenase YgiN